MGLCNAQSHKKTMTKTQRKKKKLEIAEKKSAASAAQTSDSDSSRDNIKTAIAADKDHERVSFDLAVKQNYYKLQNFEKKVAKQEDDAIYGEEIKEAKPEERDKTFYRIFRKGDINW